MGRRWGALAGAVALAVAVGAWSFSGRPDARLVALEWDRTIQVERRVGIPGSGWREELPAGAVLGRCEPRFHHHERVVTGTRQKRVPGSRAIETSPEVEVTPVEREWCAWESVRWDLARVEHAQGKDATPLWPEPVLSEGERLGARTERYRARFERRGAQHTLDATSAEVWSRLTAGRSYDLTLGPTGKVLAVKL